jgi:ERCC4-related helicase
MPRVNLLIADDVGLGKTIEAGLVMLELILRHRARNVLVVCPPSLQIQWRDQMLEKFGLEFRIVDRELFSQLRRTRGIHANPWTHFPRLISSIDFLKRDQPMRLMRDALPTGDEPRYPRRFDLLIVDEAHNIAPSGSAQYAQASDRTRAIREIAPHFEHKLFLSATPHNGYKTSFWALLELLDDQRFSRAIEPDRKQVDAVMIRRLKNELGTDWQGKPRFATREVMPIRVEYDEAERRAHRRLQEYGRVRRQRAKDDKLAQISVEFVLKTLKKRLFSSPAAFLRTIEQHIRSAESPRPVVRLKPLVKDLRAKLEAADELVESDTEALEMTEEAFGVAERFSPIGDAEREMLRELHTWAEKAAARTDQKALQLMAWLDEHVRQNDERVIIFTEYRDTQNWLFDRLAAARLTANGKTKLIYGGMHKEAREEVKAAFQADPQASPVRILLATDAASEGLDFQNYCHQVIHYEIPWNPNRLEQRNGRVDRHGQSAPQVLIYHFVSASFDETRATGQKGTLDDDLEFLWRAARKVNQIREDLGSAGTVLASEVERAMLGETATLHSLEAIGQDERTRYTRQQLTSVRQAKAEIREALEELRRTRQELDLEPERVRRAVEIALELAEQPPLRPTMVGGHRAWFVPPLGGSWARTREGLPHPFSKQERPIVFDHEVAEALRDQVVLAHLHHPLVDRCLRLLREAMWGGSIDLHRMTIRVVSDQELAEPAVIAHGRLVVTGGDGERLHEQLITAGGYLRGGQLVRMTRVSEVDAALATAPQSDSVPERLRQQFRGLWPSIGDKLDGALRARARERSNALEREVRRREGQEIEAITAVLTELAAAIRGELHSPEILQMSLFTDEEDRAQAERDRNALEHRLDQIPGELEREIAAIRMRYERTEPRLFPVAVTWLVPRSIMLANRG